MVKRTRIDTSEANTSNATTLKQVDLIIGLNGFKWMPRAKAKRAGRPSERLSGGRRPVFVTCSLADVVGGRGHNTSEVAFIPSIDRNVFRP